MAQQNVKLKDPIVTADGDLEAKLAANPRYQRVLSKSAMIDPTVKLTPDVKRKKKKNRSIATDKVSSPVKTESKQETISELLAAKLRLETELTQVQGVFQVERKAMQDEMSSMHKHYLSEYSEFLEAHGKSPKYRPRSPINMNRGGEATTPLFGSRSNVDLANHGEYLSAPVPKTPTVSGAAPLVSSTPEPRKANLQGHLRKLIELPVDLACERIQSLKVSGIITPDEALDLGIAVIDAAPVPDLQRSRPSGSVQGRLDYSPIPNRYTEGENNHPRNKRPERRYGNESDPPVERSYDVTHDDKSYATMLNHISFDGDAGTRGHSWESFHQRISLIFNQMKWPDAFKVLKLLNCLKGRAARAVEMLGPDPTYEQCVSRLSELYGASNREALYEVKLQKLRRDVNKEDPVTFMESVRYLCRYAFPRSSDYDMDQNTKRYFVMAHPTEYRNHLNSVDRTVHGTDALIRAAKQYEQAHIYQSLPRSKPVHQVDTLREPLFDPDFSDLDREIAQLEREEYDSKESETSLTDDPEPYSVAQILKPNENKFKLKKLDTLRQRSKNRKQNRKQQNQNELVQVVTQVVEKCIESHFPSPHRHEMATRQLEAPRARNPMDPEPAEWTKNVLCYYCGLRGHIFRTCRKLSADRAAGREKWLYPRPQRKIVHLVDGTYSVDPCGNLELMHPEKWTNNPFPALEYPTRPLTLPVMSDFNCRGPGHADGNNTDLNAGGAID